MFSTFEPIRPPRRRRSQSRAEADTRPDEMETFCGQFPNRMKRNFSQEVINNREVNAFQDFQSCYPPKRASNLEINRTLSQNGSPFVPLFGPNIHPLMGQMWRPLRHSQTQVIVAVRPVDNRSRESQEKPEQRSREVKAVKEVKEKAKVETFEEHFNQYKCAPKKSTECKEPAPELKSRKWGTSTLERRALSTEKSTEKMRKGSLPSVCAEGTAVVGGGGKVEPLRVSAVERRECYSGGWMGSWWPVALVVLGNLVILVLFVILMIY